jgi:hypothetical protein
MDFRTPPSAAELERIRSATAASFSKPDEGNSAAPEELPVREVQSPIKPPPVIDPGDPHAPAELDAFREHAAKGPRALMELAIHLEEQSGNARALLAWERVLDSTQPDDTQRQAAEAAIRRLRPLVPAWSVDPLAAKPLTLEVALNVGPAPEGLETVLEEVARVSGEAASGLVSFEPRLEVPAPPPKPAARTRKPTAAAAPEAETAPATLSIQILLEGESTASTGLIELPLPADPADVKRELFLAVYRLIASQLAATTNLNPPAPLDQDEDPAAALAVGVTRLSWSGFGKSLLPQNGP